LADWVGAVTVSLRPLTEAIEAYICTASGCMPMTRRAGTGPRQDADRPVVDGGAGRLRRPRSACGGVLLLAGSARRAPRELLGDFAGILQADAYSGFGRLYEHGRQPGPMREAACWAHGRRSFFKQAELQKAPLAIEAVQRIDAILAIEREINGLATEARAAARAERSRPLVDSLENWLR
jgi:transposase